MHVPARVCALLDLLARLDRVRVQVRGRDPELDAVLCAIRDAGRHWRATATGSPVAEQPEAGPRSPWLSTTEAAGLLGITDRAVRLAIASGRLDAENIGGRWRVSREAVAHYQAARQQRAA
ncbi:helix-turn-helix domain-containing protein [Streptomyces sp. SS8]